jgi:hypothetical protein
MAVLLCGSVLKTFLLRTIMLCGDYRPLYKEPTSTALFNLDLVFKAFQATRPSGKNGFGAFMPFFIHRSTRNQAQTGSSPEIMLQPYILRLQDKSKLELAKRAKTFLQLIPRLVFSIS